MKHELKGLQMPCAAAPVPGHHRQEGRMQRGSWRFLDVRKWISALSGALWKPLIIGYTFSPPNLQN